VQPWRYEGLQLVVDGDGRVIIVSQAVPGGRDYEGSEVSNIFLFVRDERGWHTQVVATNEVAEWSTASAVVTANGAVQWRSVLALPSDHATSLRVLSTTHVGSRSLPARSTDGEPPVGATDRVGAPASERHAGASPARHGADLRNWSATVVSNRGARATCPPR
jgi:hypothetical protein